MAYGILKCDTVTFTDAGVDKSVTLSGLVQNPTFSGNVTVTGTLSGVTVTGTTANFTSGNFTNISGGTHTITSGVFAAGSAASPSITFTGDLNTGIYSPGADQVAISTGGAGRLFVDASGNVGIGTSTSGGVLRVFGATGKLIIGDSNFNYFDANTQIFRDSSANERMRLDSSGRLGIGTSAPQSSIDVRGTASASSEIARIGNGTKYIGIGTEGTSYGWIQSFASTSLCLNPLGNNVGIGTTSPGAIFHVKPATDENIRFSGGSGDTRIACLNDAASATVQLSIQASPFLFRGAGGSEVGRWDTSGRLLVGTSSDSGGALLQVNGDRIRVGTAKTPASATATGTAGEICWDASYVYVCTATNTWKRSALSTW